MSLNKKLSNKPGMQVKLKKLDEKSKEEVIMQKRAVTAFFELVNRYQKKEALAYYNSLPIDCQKAIEDRIPSYFKAAHVCV